MTTPELLLSPDDFSVHVQWGPRASGVEATGGLLASVLTLTADAEPRITVWFPTDTDSWGYAVSGLSHAPDPMIGLARELADGDPPAVRVEMETSDVERTGAPLSSLDIVIGSVDPYDPNHVTWTLREAGERFLSSTGGAISMLRALILLVDPDWAAISSREIDRLQAVDPNGPTVGWVTYVAHRILRAGATPPPGVSAEPTHRGYLFTLAPRPEQTSVAAVQAMAAALR
ncbi:Imm52 family immunity protein [Micromonospora chokoriensis]|uniref:Imm52 family immunity protein n=1 Tax=Micromonospora chokoriensis TaxID=356851 RepID=UPI0004C38485|nr:Imm52 family immunity protein [Micromonospora chokoriensis]